jgi:hypothetical protein
MRRNEIFSYTAIYNYSENGHNLMFAVNMCYNLPEVDMEREVMWVSLDEQKFEHLRVKNKKDGILADGMIIHLNSNNSYRIRYRIQCDSAWQVRKVEMSRLDESDLSFVWHSDGNGHWMNNQSDAIPALDGCRDIDIYYSPFTNTLAIRRLGLNQGESAEINAAFIAVPEMTVSAVCQRYTCLDSTPEGGVYRYESLASGFTAELPVDSDKLLIEYPRFFKRMWAR